MPEIQFFHGFSGGAPCRALPCEDGDGRIDCYPLMDGVTAMLVRLNTHGFEENRPRRNGLEINFCVNGRFESAFSPRDIAQVRPGDMAVCLFDGVHGAASRSRFPLGCYDGLCLDVDCDAASGWMARNAPALAADFAALRQNLLRDRWYAACPAGPRCEHVLRELYENLPCAEPAYLRLKVLELFYLLSVTPPPEDVSPYCSAERMRLAGHIRDHLLTLGHERPSLEALAREHGISVSLLQSLFRQAYGAPVQRYLREYRLEQAAVALARSRRRVLDIALDAGYDSASKFGQVFKKRYGLTPTAYRAAKQRVKTE